MTAVTDRDVPGLPLRTRQDLILSAIVVLYVSAAYISLTALLFPESQIVPLAEAIGLLVWAYESQR